MPLPKYLRRRLEDMSWPKLLVCKDKHETGYYVLKDAEALFRACLRILRERVDCSYITEPDKTPYGLKSEFVGDLAMLPETLRDAETRNRSENVRIKKAHAQDLEEWAEVQRALAEGDGGLAWMILDRRSSYEYEGFTLITPAVP